MGFLSFFQQQPFATGIAAPQPYAPQPFAPLAPLPQQSPLGIVPRGGLNPSMQTPPILPDQRQQSPLAGLPQFNGASAIRPPSFSERVEGIFQNPLVGYGMAMLGAAQPGGGGFGQAGQDILAIQNAHAQRQRQEREDERQDTQWTWMRDAQQQNQQRRQMAADYIASRPPAEQAELRMIDPDQLGEYIQRQRAFDLQMEESRNNERRFQQGLQIDRARLANDRLSNSLQSRLGMLEANSFGDMQGRLQNWRLIDNDLERIRYWVDHPRADELWNTLAEGDQETVIRRFTSRNDLEGLQMAQEVYSIGAQLARDELRGQTPVSNIDFLAALRGNPNTSSTRGFVRNWLDRAYQDRATLEQQYQSALAHAQAHGNLYAPDPATGRNWYQNTYNLYGQREQGGNNGGRGQTQGAPTPRRGDVVDGYRFMGGDPGDRRNWVRVNGGAADRNVVRGRGGAQRPLW